MNEARAEPAAAPVGATNEQPSKAAADPIGRWSRPEVWMLGAFSVIGLVGFAATFVLVVMRGPDSQGSPARSLTAAEIQKLAGPPGERGPAGPPGPRGAAGDSGIRIARGDCATGNCTVECGDDEVLLNAYCNPNRTPATYPADNSALCRTAGRGRIEVVAACVKARR